MSVFINKRIADLVLIEDSYPRKYKKLESREK